MKLLRKDRTTRRVPLRCWFLKGKTLDLYTEEEREVIKAYNEILVPAGWLPVNAFTEAVRRALEMQDCDVELLTDLFEGAREGRDDVAIPRQRTLVRLIWENY